MAGACCETGRGLCWKKNAKVCSWEKEERQTEKMLGRLHQGRSEENGNERGRRVGQEQVAMQDPHRRPHLKRDLGQKKEEVNILCFKNILQTV